jgi:hypothetical protein
MADANIFEGMNSWSEFTTALNPLPEKQKGDAFELLVAVFLRTNPIYRSLLESVWLLAEVPDDIRRKLHLPGPDEGIDLVAQTFVGEFWAIQAKYRSDASGSLTHMELSTFTSLAFVVCHGISFGLVCTTTDRVTDLLEGNPRIGFRTAETWQHLSAEIFAAARAGLAQIHKLELWRLRPQGGGQLSWKDYCVNKFPNLPKRPEDCIPTAPDKVYAKSGWKGFQDWVGNPHAHPKPSIET